MTTTISLHNVKWRPTNCISRYENNNDNNVSNYALRTIYVGIRYEQQTTSYELQPAPTLFGRPHRGGWKKGDGSFHSFEMFVFSDFEFCEVKARRVLLTLLIWLSWDLPLFPSPVSPLPTLFAEGRGHDHINHKTSGDINTIFTRISKICIKVQKTYYNHKTSGAATQVAGRPAVWRRVTFRYYYYY